MKVEEFVGIDFSSLEDDWHKKEGEFAPEGVTERAKQVRKWLRDRSEKEIVGESQRKIPPNLLRSLWVTHPTGEFVCVVVAHGGILRRIIKAPPGEVRFILSNGVPNCIELHFFKEWANCEGRVSAVR